MVASLLTNKAWQIFHNRIAAPRLAAQNFPHVGFPMSFNLGPPSH